MANSRCLPRNSSTSGEAEVYYLDTSVVLRYILGEHPLLSPRAAAMIEGDDQDGEDRMLTDAIIAEVGYVLTKVYGIPRNEAIDAMVALIQRRNIRVHATEKRYVLQALEFCRPSGRVSFADALLWAAARTAGATVIYSFDERFPSDGIAIRREP